MRLAWFAAMSSGLALGLSGLAAASAQASSAPGEVVTEPAEATATGVKLKGRLNPDGLPTTYEFEYSASGCDDYRSYCVEQTATGVVSGDSQQEVPAMEVTGLVAGETYSYKLLARNTKGGKNGAFVDFTVPELGQGPWPPSTLVEPAAVTVAGVQLKGKVDPGGLPTTYYFQYVSQKCDEDAGGSYLGCLRKTVVSGPLTGETMQEATVEVTGLEAGRYSYELVAHNADGTSEGNEVQFTVGAPTAPLIESESVSHLTSTDATLEAKINPDGLVEPDSLPSGAAYQFQLVKNTSESLQEMFCTEAGVAQPVGYGCGGNWGTGPDVIPLGDVIGGGSAGRQVSLDLAGAGVTLQPGTTYHYRVLAARYLSSEEGGVHWESAAVVGPDHTFTTPPTGEAPKIDSVSISHVTPTDATLEAQINTEGQATTYEFLMYSGCAYCEDTATRSIHLPSGLLLGSFVDQSVSLDLNSVGVTLEGGKYYGYSMVATSRAGSTEALWQTLEPPFGEEAEPLSFPVTNDPPAPLGESSQPKTPTLDPPPALSKHQATGHRRGRRGHSAKERRRANARRHRKYVLAHKRK